MSRHPDSTPDGRWSPRRATDRVEDAVGWLLMAAGLVLVVTWSTGMAVYSGNVKSASTLTRTRPALGARVGRVLPGRR
jgi:hypothetical protein